MVLLHSAIIIITHSSYALKDCVDANLEVLITFYPSVPARLVKGQGAKEIGHNLACERPKFGHNLVRKRLKSGTILWAIDENMGTNRQAVTCIFTSAV